MSKILSVLHQAFLALPSSIAQARRADIVLTLFLWKVWSVRRQRDGYFLHAGQVLGESAFTLQLMESNRVFMPDAALFEHCEWQRLTKPGTAIFKSLLMLDVPQQGANLIPIVRPERFAAGGPDHVALSCHGSLTSVMDQLNAMTVDDLSAPNDIGNLFEQARLTLLPPDLTMHDALYRLAAQLLEIWPQATVFDPACGQGDFLMAAWDHVAKQFPSNSVVLLGQDDDADATAMAQMRLLAKSLVRHRIDTARLLTDPMRTYDDGHLVKADILFLMVPSKRRKWSKQEVRPSMRFPAGIPNHMGLALIWATLAHLAPGGRMALVVSLDVFVAQDGIRLRQHLIRERLLKAVIMLPDKEQSRFDKPHHLIIIERGPLARDTLCFARPPVGRGEYTMDMLLHAWQALQEGRAYPYVQRVPSATFENNGYQLNPALYSLL